MALVQVMRHVLTLTYITWLFESHLGPFCISDSIAVWELLMVQGHLVAFLPHLQVLLFCLRWHATGLGWRVAALCRSQAPYPEVGLFHLRSAIRTPDANNQP
jgi:hypothetical protein